MTHFLARSVAAIRHRRVFTLSVAIVLAAPACGPSEQETAPPAAVQTQDVSYDHGGTPLKGFVAWKDSAGAKRPGILIVHEWWGHNEFAREQARRLASAGYVAFALDMFGEGRSTMHPKEAEGMMNEAMSDPATMTGRFNAALSELRGHSAVDPERIAAIGFCFGGAVVLMQARTGADLDAAVSIHGAIPAGSPLDSGNVKARVLMLAGGADPMAPAAQVEAFRTEMESAGARIEVISFPGVKHSFTNPRADSVGMDALAYDAQAEQQSWEAMLRLFREFWP